MKFMMNGALTWAPATGPRGDSDAAGYEKQFYLRRRVEDFPKTIGYYNPRGPIRAHTWFEALHRRVVDGTLGRPGDGMFLDLYNGLLNGSSCSRPISIMSWAISTNTGSTGTRSQYAYLDRCQIGRANAGTTSPAAAVSVRTVPSGIMPKRFGMSAVSG
jgi:hypothetical protein